jgi:hypothetical protein
MEYKWSLLSVYNFDRYGNGQSYVKFNNSPQLLLQNLDTKRVYGVTTNLLEYFLECGVAIKYLPMYYGYFVDARNVKIREYLASLYETTRESYKDEKKLAKRRLTGEKIIDETTFFFNNDIFNTVLKQKDNLYVYDDVLRNNKVIVSMKEYWNNLQLTKEDIALLKKGIKTAKEKLAASVVISANNKMCITLDEINPLLRDASYLMHSHRKRERLNLLTRDWAWLIGIKVNTRGTIYFIFDTHDVIRYTLNNVVSIISRAELDTYTDLYTLYSKY